MTFLMARLSKYWWPGRHLKFFLLTGISKRNNFCRKKKKDVVVYSNIYDKFISSNLTYKLKIKEKLNLNLNR